VRRIALLVVLSACGGRAIGGAAAGEPDAAGSAGPDGAGESRVDAAASDGSTSDDASETTSSSDGAPPSPIVGWWLCLSGGVVGSWDWFNADGTCGVDEGGTCADCTYAISGNRIVIDEMGDADGTGTVSLSNGNDTLTLCGSGDPVCVVFSRVSANAVNSCH
jgi:hypothetical protein